MKSTKILDLMIKDHNRLMEYLKDVENNLGHDFGFLSNSFNNFPRSSQQINFLVA